MKLGKWFYYGTGITAVFFLVLFSSYSPIVGEPGDEPEAPGQETPSGHITRAKHAHPAGVIQQVGAFDLDKDFYFAGKRIPTENQDVYERLDREILHIAYHHTSTILAMKRAKRVFPVIEPILEKYGLPNDLKYLAVTESSLANATSGAGAKGVWQFMKGTAAYYGLEVNREVDERNHLEKATVAACKYLKHYYDQFGSWALAAAAYNMGGPRLKKAMMHQKGKSFYDLNLNSETMRYFFRIVAHKEILEHPEAYGYFIDDYLKYNPLPASRIVKVSGPVSNWGSFARKYGMSYRELKRLNPWIKSYKLTNKRHKTYEVRVLQ